MSLKIVVACILGFAAAVVLAACGDNDENAQSTTTAARTVTVRTDRTPAQNADQSAGVEQPPAADQAATVADAQDQTTNPNDPTQTGTTATETTATTPSGVVVAGAQPNQDPDTASGEAIEGEGEALPEGSVATDAGTTPGIAAATDPANQGAEDINPETEARLEAQETRQCLVGSATVRGEADTTRESDGDEEANRPSGATGTDDATESDTGEAVLNPGALGSVRFFSLTSPWNVRVDTLPTQPGSAELVRQADERQVVVEEKGGRVRLEVRRLGEGIFINTCRWTVPVVSEQGGVPTPIACRQINCGEDAAETRQLAIPPSESPDPRYDGWFTVINRPQNVAYDMWRARRERDGSISYQFLRKWRLNGPGFLKPGLPSARGSGLPLFAGLLRPDELRGNARINHALAISVPGPARRRYVQPASRTDGVNDPVALPIGARLRLRGNVRLAGTRLTVTRRVNGRRVKVEIPRRGNTLGQRRGTDRRAQQAILTALRDYGAIVVDRAATPTLYAQKNASYRGLLPGNALQGIRLADFDVVQLGQFYNDPPLNRGDVLVNPPSQERQQRVPAGNTAGGGS